MVLSLAYIVTPGIGWQNAGKWFWDVYVENVQGQPSLKSGECYSERGAYEQAQHWLEIEERKINEND